MSATDPQAQPPPEAVTHDADTMDASPSPNATRLITPLTSFESLPFDILHNVLFSLDYATVHTLALTNSRLHASIIPDELCTRDSKIDFYLEVEQFDQHKDHLACLQCFRFLHRTAFADKHRKGRRGKGSFDRRKRERFCWECCRAKQLVPHLRDGLKKDGKVWYLCHQCGEWKTNETRCVEMPWGGTFCVPQEQAVKPSRLERLPGSVMKQVLGELGYQDRIRLAATGQGMRRVIGDPSKWGSVLEMFEFMLSRKGRLSRGWRSYYACYGCWKWKRSDKFSAKQRELTNWTGEGGLFCHRRRCNFCLEKFYGSGRETEEGKAALARWRTQTVCGRCRKMKIVEEGMEGYEVCEGCERNRLRALAREESVLWKVSREKVVGETNMLQVDEDVVAVFFHNADKSDPWDLENDDALDFRAFMERVEREAEDIDSGALSRLMDWLVDLSDRTPKPGISDEELPSQSGSDATSIRTGFDVWLVYDKFFGKKADADTLTADTEPAETPGESSSAASAAVEAEATTTETAEDEPQAKRHRRFLSGQMSLAEQSLYLRIQALLGRQRDREEARQQRHSSTILEMVSERLRGLGFRMASRRTEVAS
ncbi:hypothetical protein OQA88_7941 [Cercophora sp. LCS_1]